MVSGFTMYRNQRNKCWNIFVLSDENVLSRIYHNSQKDTTLAKKLQLLWRVDTQNSQSGLKRVSVKRNQTNSMFLKITAYDTVVLVVTVEFLSKFEEIVTNIVRLQAFGGMRDDFVIFAQFSHKRTIFR